MNESAREAIRRKLKEDQKREDRRRTIVRVAIASVCAITVAAVVALIVIAGGGSSTSDEDYSLGEETTAAKDSPTEDYLALGAKDDEPVVDVYLDFMCPYCGEFHKANEKLLDDLVNDDSVTLRVHPRVMLTASGSTDYSTRAAIAFTTVYQSDPEAALKYLDLLFEDQPSEGSKGLTNSELQDIARDAGSDADVVSAIEQGRYRTWIEDTVETNAQKDTEGTPWIEVNGEQLTDWRDSDDLAAKIEDAR